MMYAQLPEPFEEAAALAKDFSEKVSECFGVQINQDATSCLGFWPLLAHTINNLGDPFTGRGGHLVTFEQERELVHKMAALLQLPEHDTWGYYNPGSTFSNIHGIHLGMRRFHDPVVVLSTGAHYSFVKAALLTRCKQVLRVATTRRGDMDPEDLARKLKANGTHEEYIFVFCSGTVARGAYDDVPALLEVIREVGVPDHSFMVHLDAALGGMITPFLPPGSIQLDFSIPEVDTLSVSFHKRLGIPLPGSLFLARRSVVDNLPCSPFAECVASYDTTIGGSRDGLTPFMTLVMLNRVGVDGMRRRTREILDKADWLVARLQEHGVDAWHNEGSPCVVLPAPSAELCQRYHMPVFTDAVPKYTHIFTMEHVKEEALTRFIDAYVSDPVIRSLSAPVATAESTITPAPRLASPDLGIPQIALGTYRLPSGWATYDAVSRALDMGYRCIDTAAAYGNEADVGRAVRSSGIEREEVFLCTKLAPSRTRAGEAGPALRESLDELGLDYVDLYLIHAPVHPEERVAVWRELVELRARGLARAIGVSNYGVRHLEEIAGIAVPAVNQIELSPYNRRPAVVDYCRNQDIQLMAWAPLTRGTQLSDPVITEIAGRVGCTPAQVLLRWAVEQGFAMTVGSTHPSHMRENLNLWDISLPADALRVLDELDRGLTTDWDPASRQT